MLAVNAVERPSKGSPCKVAAEVEETTTVVAPAKRNRGVTAVTLAVTAESPDDSLPPENATILQISSLLIFHLKSPTLLQSSSKQKDPVLTYHLETSKWASKF